MKISVSAPERELPDYLREVAEQLASGFSSGHVDATTHWATEEFYDG